MLHDTPWLKHVLLRVQIWPIVCVFVVTAMWKPPLRAGRYHLLFEEYVPPPPHRPSHSTHHRGFFRMQLFDITERLVDCTFCKRKNEKRLHFVVVKPVSAMHHLISEPGSADDCGAEWHSVYRPPPLQKPPNLGKKCFFFSLSPTLQFCILCFSLCLCLSQNRCGAVPSSCIIFIPKHRLCSEQMRRSLL